MTAAVQRLDYMDFSFSFSLSNKSRRKDIGMPDSSLPFQHSLAFRFRRFFNWFPLGLTYAFLYMGRYNLTVAKNALGNLMTKEQFGIIFAAGTITYAFAFLINGPLTDRVGGKRAILASAIGSAAMNVLMGVLTYFLLLGKLSINTAVIFSVIYAANMYFQSFGAVAIVKVNAAWFHVRERGVFGGIFGVLISLGLYFAFDWGYAIVLATQAHVTVHLNFLQAFLRHILSIEGSTMDQTWWVFFVPAFILAVFFLLDLLILRDRPGQAGFRDFDTGDASSGEEDKPFRLGEILKRILTDRIIITIATIEFCTGILRNGIMHWYPIFSNEYLHLPPDHFLRENWGLILMLAGVLGGLSAGIVSDKVFGSRRGPVAALLYGLMLVSTITMAFVLDLNPYVLGAIVMLMSLCVIGTHGVLSGTSTMDFGGRRAAGTAVGLIDGCVYLGTGVQSLSLGFLTTQNWHLWPPFLIPFAIFGLVQAIRIWYAYPKAKTRQ
jgi:OPA family glycerol-3-phosphate transporter-like MFS transporter